MRRLRSWRASLCRQLPADGAGERIANFRIGHTRLAQLGDDLAKLALRPLLQIELAVRFRPRVNVGAAVALHLDDRIPFQQLVSLRHGLAVELEIVGELADRRQRGAWLQNAGSDRSL